MVRGDSLRDLYAKALALLGLGLLGATGALVNYWPVQNNMPGVASALVVPAGVPVPSIAEASVDVTTWSVEPRRPAASLRHLAAASSDVVAADASEVTTLGLAEPSAASATVTSDLPPSLVVAPATTANMPASPLELLPPVITAAGELPDLSPVPTSQNGGNMLTGAARTVGRAGHRTGTAVWGGFVSVASAVGHVFHW